MTYEQAVCLAFLPVYAYLRVSEDYVVLVVLHAIHAFLHGEEGGLILVKCKEEGFELCQDIRS